MVFTALLPIVLLLSVLADVNATRSWRRRGVRYPEYGGFYGEDQYFGNYPPNRGNRGYRNHDHRHNRFDDFSLDETDYEPNPVTFRPGRNRPSADDYYRPQTDDYYTSDYGDQRETTSRPRSGGIQLSPKDCGTTNAVASRIVGGREATDHEYPWQVSIQVNHLPVSGGEYTQYCGAAILNERWVLTAAHCLGAPLSAMKGVVGTNDVGNPGSTAREFFFDKAIKHQSYNEKNKDTKYNNDIALLRTKTKIPFDTDKTINSVCLARKGSALEGKASVAGWGKTSELGEKSDKLRTVDVPVLESSVCKKVYKSLYDDRLMMCAGDLKGGRDSCQADSGGPLVQPQKDTYYVIGVVSYGIGCARKGNPGVYTKVTNYIDWINDTMKKNS